jgi:hypothetical protein
MVHSDPRQSFGIISLFFFGYTISDPNVYMHLNLIVVADILEDG